MTVKTWKTTCKYCQKPIEKRASVKPTYCNPECARNWRRYNGGSYIFPFPTDLQYKFESIDGKYHDHTEPEEDL